MGVEVAWKESEEVSRNLFFGLTHARDAKLPGCLLHGGTAGRRNRGIGEDFGAWRNASSERNGWLYYQLWFDLALYFRGDGNDHHHFRFGGKSAPQSGVNPSVCHSVLVARYSHLPSLARARHEIGREISRQVQEKSRCITSGRSWDGRIAQPSGN